MDRPSEEIMPPYIDAWGVEDTLGENFGQFGFVQITNMPIIAKKTPPRSDSAPGVLATEGKP